MRTFTATALLASMLASVTQALTSEQPWIVDLRGNEEETILLVLESGESFDVLVQGNPTTGYQWQNEIQWNQRNNNLQGDDSGIVFLGEHEDLDSDSEQNTRFLPGSHSDPVKVPQRMMGGAKHDFIHSFTTQSGVSTYEELKFGYFRSFEVFGPTFPDAEDTQDYHALEVIIKDEFKHDILLTELHAFADTVPDEMEVEAGDWIRFRLPETPGTGYMWMTDADTQDDRSKHGGTVKQIFNDYHQPQVDGLLGASGERVIIFEVMDRADNIHLSFRRPWISEEANSSEATPNKTIQFKQIESGSSSKDISLPSTN